jgi:hypothetical protein
MTRQEQQRRHFVVERLKSRKTKKVAVGFAQKQEKKEWFDEECATANGEKNCARARAIQIQNRTRATKLTAMNEYRQAQRREKHLFRKKKGQLDNQVLLEIERHHSVQDPRKFYKLNDTKKPLEPAVAMCRATNGQHGSTALPSRVPVRQINNRPAVRSATESGKKQR